jgi:hypothetical protein
MCSITYSYIADTPCIPLMSGQMLILHVTIAGLGTVFPAAVLYRATFFPSFTVMEVGISGFQLLSLYVKMLLKGIRIHLH